MKTVLVTGGAGMLGRHIITALVRSGHTARIMSRSPQPTSIAIGTEWAQADLESGQGVDEAVSGVDTIIHAASSPFNVCSRLMKRERNCCLRRLMWLV